MTFKVGDGVWETTTTPGTGALTLLGAKAGYGPFSGVLSDGDQTFYCVHDGAQFEAGSGTLSIGTSTTLSRDTVISNSAGNTSRINWGTGTRDVFIFLPASRIAILSAVNVWLADQKLRGNKLFLDGPDSSWLTASADNVLSFFLAATELLQLDGLNQRLLLKSAEDGTAAGPELRLSRRSPTPANLDDLGAIRFLGNNAGLLEVPYGKIRVQIIDKTSNAHKGHMGFEVAGGDGSTAGVFHLESGVAYLDALADLLGGGKSASAPGTVGWELLKTGQLILTPSGVTGFTINRLATDGTLADLQRGGVSQGSISVSGATVSYNTFCGGHWSEWAESLVEPAFGTVVETVDATLDDIERLPKVRIARPGSKRVYGAYAGVDDAGHLIIHALGATQVLVKGPVEGGDLLTMSDEPGIATRQTEVWCHAGTIGKVSVGDSSAETRLVPAVLYAG